MIATLRQAAAALALILVAASASQAAQVAPHRAAYELSLDRATSASDVIDVSGTMDFEWADSCNGWTVKQKSLMTVGYSTGESAQLGWNLLSWEAKDGLKYRFLVRDLQNGTMADQFKGEAALDGPGRGGKAVYSVPDKKVVKLPPGTLFPTAHSLKLLQNAEADQTLLWEMVFDGSDAKGLFGVNAVISHRQAQAQAQAQASGGKLSSPLLATPAWRINLAYFAPEGQAAEPQNEQHIDIHDNGVVDLLIIDYGTFRVRARLIKIESLRGPAC
jgi:hypothetical protein